MKKLLFISLIFLSLVSISEGFSGNKTTYYVPVPTYTMTDSDAIAYVDAIGDVPEYQKEAIDKRVIAFKSNGTWSILKFCLIAPLSMTMNEGLRDLKTNSIYSTWMVGNPMVAVSTETSYAPYALVSAQGFVFSNMDGQKGTVKVNFVPNGNLTLNSTCWGAIYQDQTTALAGYNGGSFQNTGASMLFQKKDAGNFLYSDAYNTTLNTGRARQSSTSGAGGNFIFNRASGTDFKIYRNGTQIASSTGGAGALPTTTFYINGHSANVGTTRQETCGAMYCYSRALTTTELAQEETDWQTFMTDMRRTGSYSRKIIWSGNSQSVMFYGAMFRKMMYDMSDSIWSWTLAARHGKTTIQITSALGSEVYPYLKAAYDTNYVYLWEATNDISAGSSGRTAYAHYQTYVSTVKSYCSTNSIPVKVIVVPSMARKFTGNDNAILQTDTFNVMLDTGWHSWADGYINIHTDSTWAWRSSYGSNSAYCTAIRNLCGNTAVYDAGGTHLQKAMYLFLEEKKFVPYIRTH